ncbi:MAG: hypothetical protein FGM37_05560 [Phycisphaerales bacterium]|nr:hypothetical protein [Phycisphaerales bacterium]
MRWPGLLALALVAAAASAAPQAADAQAEEPPPPPLPALMEAPEWAGKLAALARTRTGDAFAQARMQAECEATFRAIAAGLERRSPLDAPWSVSAVLNDPWRALPVAATLTGPLAYRQALQRQPYAVAARAAAMAFNVREPVMAITDGSGLPGSAASGGESPEGTPPPDPLAPRHGSIPVMHAQSAVFAMRFLLEQSGLHMRVALEPVLESAGMESGALAPLLAEAAPVVSQLKWMPKGEPDEATTRMVDAMRAATRIDPDALARAIAHWDADIYVTADWAQAEQEPLPDALAGAVTGAILVAEMVPDLGWVVIGSLADNSYDMSRIAAVLDPGGDDEYRWTAVRTGMQGIIDLAGNDRYLGTGLQGPAAGILGMCVIDDYAGNDRYDAPWLGAGAAVAGAGILVDRAGNDTYRIAKWGCGAAIGGVGLLLDVAGHDDYEGTLFVQGVGGPSALGALVDADGNDRYRAAGSEPSTYMTPATSLSFSQGLGFGFRTALAGGTGIMLDLGGDDRYFGGEFSQGGGYFLGIGIARDTGGRDYWSGDRYAQGWSAHQAIGVLIDDSGDDVFLSRTAASQGAAWDQSVSVLADRNGNDTYRADGLAQGSAAQQAFALMIDCGGDDTLDAAAPVCQGGSGANEYHFDATGARSMSVLLLLDGYRGAAARPAERTRCSAGRLVPGITITGTAPRSLADAVTAAASPASADAAPAPATALLMGISIIDASGGNPGPAR